MRNHGQRFRTARKGSQESYRELTIRMNDLLKKWLKKCTTVDGVLEALLIEQLVSTMPTELKVWIKERQPKTSTEAGELADQFVQARKDLRMGTVRQEKQSVTVEKKRCHECNELGHIMKDCPKKKFGNKVLLDGKDKRPLVCYNCHQKGHKSSECPANALSCTELEKQKSCPYTTGMVNNKSVNDVILDTGCSRTMVRRDLVKLEERENAHATPL